MTVARDGAVIHLRGHCRVEDAEPLAALLQAEPGLPVDLAACDGLHGAVVQALLAFRPAIRGLPEGAFLRDLVLPALSGERQSGSGTV
ncbi:MAG TPA: hypothetical protein VGM87_15680 [Roseomonas sp.]|jgi:hypothetical protein